MKPQSSTSSLRLFTAIDLPEAIQHELDPLLQSLPSRRPVFASRLHLTLNFLGQVEQDLFERLKEALPKIHLEAFPLCLQGLGCFPSEAKARVLWLGVQASQSLALLKQKLDQALGALGFSIDTRPFRPHLTLLRIREARQISGILRWMKAHRDFKSKSFRVDGFQLFSSRPTPQGSEYRRELTVSLSA